MSESRSGNTVSFPGVFSAHSLQLDVRKSITINVILRRKVDHVSHLHPNRPPPPRLPTSPPPSLNLPNPPSMLISGRDPKLRITIPSRRQNVRGGSDGNRLYGLSMLSRVQLLFASYFVQVSVQIRTDRPAAFIYLRRKLYYLSFSCVGVPLWGMGTANAEISILGR